MVLFISSNIISSLNISFIGFAIIEVGVLVLVGICGYFFYTVLLWRNQMLKAIKSEHQQLIEQRQDEVQRFFWSACRGDLEQQTESHRAEIIAIDGDLDRLKTNFEYLKKCSLRELKILYNEDYENRQKTQEMFNRFGQTSCKTKMKFKVDDIHASLLNRVLKDDLGSPKKGCTDMDSKEHKTGDKYQNNSSGWKCREQLCYVSSSSGTKDSVLSSSDSWSNECTQHSSISDDGSSHRQSMPVMQKGTKRFTSHKREIEEKGVDGTVEEWIKEGMEEKSRMEIRGNDSDDSYLNEEEESVDGKEHIHQCNRDARESNKKSHYGSHCTDIHDNRKLKRRKTTSLDLDCGKHRNRTDADEIRDMDEMRLEELRTVYKLNQLRQRKHLNISNQLDQIKYNLES